SAQPLGRQQRYSRRYPDVHVSVLRARAGRARGGAHVRARLADARAACGGDEYGTLHGVAADDLIATDIANEDVARRRLDSRRVRESGSSVTLDAVVVGLHGNRAVDNLMRLQSRPSRVALPVGIGVLEHDPAVERAIAAGRVRR